MSRAPLATGLVLLVLALSGCPAEDLLARITDPSGQVVLEERVEVVDDDEGRAIGLSGRDALDGAMLLRFPVEDEICIQNGTVSFAIDAVFIDAEGLVRAVESNIAAGDASLRCHQETADVLEVNAGVADDVRVGDEFTLLGD